MLKQLPKIIGMCKVRNEELIIKDTLDNWSNLCTGGIIIYDDCSMDKTVNICKHHRTVKEVIEGTFWDPDREKAEWQNRQMILLRAQQLADENTWFVYFDADEHIYNFDAFELFENPLVKAIACRLYDIYITPEDKDAHYKLRNWVGPEFRTIIYFFRNMQGIKYHLPDQRIVTLPEGLKVPIHGDIKHYGKGFSVEQWEQTCDYYIQHWPKYAEKWKQRKGKAIHTGMESDFGNKLVRWEDRGRGFPLENQSYGQN